MNTHQPYPGLRPFECDEADIFFGREKQTDELLSRLNTTRFLSIVGASGCGKSSLVCAGMIPALESGFMAAAGSRWQFVKMRPGSHPISRLTTALIEQADLLSEDMNKEDGLGFLNATLRRGPLGLVDALTHTPLPPQTNLLIFVDQFEEIFRFRTENDRDEADAFVALLIASTRQRDMPVYVAITMRSDFIGDCALFDGLPEILNESQYLTPRLTREQQHMVIVGPARVFGGDVEPALVNSLLNEMGTDPDQLPLLQHLLMRLWTSSGLHQGALQIPQAAPAELPGRILTKRNSEAIGGLRRALSNHLNETYDELDDKQKCIAEALFRRLSERGTDQRDIRRPTIASEIAALTGATLDQLVDVVDAFRSPDRSFLVPRYPETIYPNTVLDITHESLIRQWDRLRGWAEQEAQSAETYRFLKQAAHRWQQGISGLWRTPDLETALAWKSRERPSMAWALRYGGGFELAMQFLDTSEQAWRTEERRAEASRIRELRRTRLQAWAGAIVAVLLLGVIAFFYVGFWRQCTYYARDFTKVWGVPRPVGTLPESAVKHRPWTLRLTKKGWFNEIQMMEVIDASHNLTPRNPILTNLATPNVVPTQQEKESRYEFVFDRAGRIVYEVAFDRFGKMTWGAVHAPQVKSESAHPPSTQAMFLGSDGYPQPQGQSRAEFVTIKYDARGFAVQQSYSDREGRPMPGSDGAFGHRREYDEAGREIRRTSLDEYGKSMIDAAGNAGMEIKYDSAGNVIEGRAFDTMGEPTLLKAGFYRMSLKYDRWGRLTEKRTFNLRNEPVNETEKTSAHWTTLEYDNQGNVTSTKLHDTADRPIVGGQGIFTFPAYEERSTFTRKNSLERRSYYNQHGKALTGPDGWHSYQMEYDEHGFVAAISYFDKDNRPVSKKSSGAHRWERVNDEFGQATEERFFDTMGKPVMTLAGYHLRENEYDTDGNLTVQTYFDTGNKPVGDSITGAHRKTTSFDRFRHPILEEYFDTSNNRVNNRQGFHRQQSNYDDYGALIDTRWYDKNSLPTNGPNGVHLLHCEYDSRGLLSRTTCYDTATQPVADKYGIYETLFDYNQKRQQTKRQAFGLNRKPAEYQDGSHVVLREFDERGRETRITKLRADGSPNWDRDLGIATRKQIWDKENRWTEQAYYDTNDRLVVCPQGFAKGTVVYHADGRVEYQNIGTDGRPVFNPLVGYASRNVDPRQKGETTESYHGPDGTLITGPEGYAEMRLRWDDNRMLLSKAFFGPNNAPVIGTKGYHRAQRSEENPTLIKHFDTQNRELPVTYQDAIILVIYIAKITDIKQPAAKSGLQAGDVLWKYGSWSFAGTLDAERAKGTNPEAIFKGVWQAFINERDRLSAEPVPVTIIRGGQPLTFEISPLPRKSIGVEVKERAIPATMFAEWKKEVHPKSEPGP